MHVHAPDMTAIAVSTEIPNTWNKWSDSAQFHYTTDSPAKPRTQTLQSYYHTTITAYCAAHFAEPKSSDETRTNSCVDLVRVVGIHLPIHKNSHRTYLHNMLLQLHLGVSDLLHQEHLFVLQANLTRPQQHISGPSHRGEGSGRGNGEGEGVCSWSYMA